MERMLIITNHFMRYAQAPITSLKTANCTAQALWDWFLVHYSPPESLISDQSPNLENNLISELCKLANVWKLHTSPYHPQTNGQCEQFNHTLISMWGTLPPNVKSSWRDKVLMLLHMYNCTRSTDTEFSPYCLMYGQKSWLPVDLHFSIQKADMNTTQVLHLCNYYMKEWSGHTKLPSMSLKRKNGT